MTKSRDWSRLPAEQRFALQCASGEGSCWYWTGALTAGGYGQFTLEGRRTTAHRAAYQLLVGEIPEGCDIDHLCKNRRCVNPKHLEAVTPRENVYRSDNPRALRRHNTHCLRGHEYTEENTIRKSNGTRRCRTCTQERDRRRGRRRG